MTSTTSVELNFKRNEMVILGTEVGFQLIAMFLLIVTIVRRRDEEGYL